MSFDSYEYESTNKFVDPINKISPFRNRISTINIEINDMIDQNDSTYSITLYSASSFAPGMNVGDEIKLVFDADYGIENDINNITVPNDELVVKYGVGYYVYNITEEGKTNILKEVNKIQVPTAVSKNGYSYTFDGYYYEYNRNGTTEEVQIVDENGNIIATNTYFIIYQVLHLLIFHKFHQIFSFQIPFQVFLILSTFLNTLYYHKYMRLCLAFYLFCLYLFHLFYF